MSFPGRSRVRSVTPLPTATALSTVDRSRVQRQDQSDRPLPPSLKAPLPIYRLRRTRSLLHKSTALPSFKDGGATMPWSRHYTSFAEYGKLPAPLSPPPPVDRHRMTLAMRHSLSGRAAAPGRQAEKGVAVVTKMIDRGLRVDDGDAKSSGSDEDGGDSEEMLEEDEIDDDGDQLSVSADQDQEESEDDLEQMYESAEEMTYKSGHELRDDDDGDNGDDDQEEDEDDGTVTQGNTPPSVSPFPPKPRRARPNSQVQIGSDGAVVFPYPNYMHIARVNRGPTRFVSSGNLVVRYKISSSVWEYNAVRNALRSAGMQSTTSTSLANIYWGRHLPSSCYGKLIANFQKLNHFPGTWCIGRKDRLAISMTRAKKQFGARDFPFVPTTFVLPADRAALESSMAIASPSAVWITKPYSSSCGKGIKLTQKISRISKKTRCVVSRYIRNPFKVDGYKFDLRLYCVVTCMDPLRIYTLDDGLVRFATEKFTLRKSCLNHRRMHLTNYSVNKNSKEFVKNSAAEISAIGSKWSLQSLLKWFDERGIDSKEVMARVNDLMVKTIIVAEATVHAKSTRYKVGRTNCFEVFGIDVLLDSKLQPWLLEVNILPSLSSSSPMDKFIKTKLMSDVFNLVGVPAVDAKTQRAQPSPPGATLSTRRSIADLTSRERLDYVQLPQADIDILREVELEYRRRGHLQRLFPVDPTASSYARFFACQRYNNALVAKWLALPRRAALCMIGFDS